MTDLLDQTFVNKCTQFTWHIISVPPSKHGFCFIKVYISDIYWQNISLCTSKNLQIVFFYF